jgi:hypothetical protein
MAVNDQYLPGHEPFGMGGIGSTGAPGTPTPSASVSQGPEVGRPVIRAPYQSAQTPGDAVSVLSGDTCSSSVDGPVPPGGDPLTGLSVEQVTMTGAGQGHASHFVHPNSAARRPA